MFFSRQKRLAALLACLLMLVPALSGALPQISISSGNDVFEERLLYGGYAVDVGDSIFFADENGIKRRLVGSEESSPVVPVAASYLNYSRGRIWFISGNGVFSCLPDGSDLSCFREYKTAISHLYVSESNIYLLRGESVYSLSDSGDKLLFSRGGMVGFIPESGGFRWMSENPGYVYVEETGDEVYSEPESEFITHFVNSAGNETAAYAADGSGSGFVSAAASASGSGLPVYTGPYVNVGSVTLPLENHMPGTFFSKNGKACVCHHTSSTYCIDSVGNCNCMRYYPTGYKETCEVDLLGAQCFAFARMVFYTCFGFIDHSMNASLYYNAGTLARGAATANTVRELMQKAAPGAHVRLASGHSVSILSMDDDFLVIYHGNAGGDGVASAPCVVSTRRYTWEQFANSAAAGILYINMPVNYPGTSVKLTDKETGFYRLTSNLNLRADSNTQSASLGVIPNNTIIAVTEAKGLWGRTEYNGTSGWVFLEYATYYSAASVAPSENSPYVRDMGGNYIRGSVFSCTLDLFAEYFDKQNITVTGQGGDPLDGGEYVGTGCTVSLTVGDKAVDSAVLVLSGDVNGNGFIDVGDYVAVRRCVLGSFELSGARAAAADASGDGSVGVDDYMIIKRYFLGTYRFDTAD